MFGLFDSTPSTLAEALQKWSSDKSKKSTDRLKLKAKWICLINLAKQDDACIFTAYQAFGSLLEREVARCDRLNAHYNLLGRASPQKATFYTLLAHYFEKVKYFITSRLLNNTGVMALFEHVERDEAVTLSELHSWFDILIHYLPTNKPEEFDISKFKVAISLNGIKWRCPSLKPGKSI